ncbi:hypothetical protein TR2A62_0847 [Thalassobium sp. R2A62]|nr:hypothetical protein TR2A62_0847 [Thalassobium sp. R2A62]
MSRKISVASAAPLRSLWGEQWDKLGVWPAFCVSVLLLVLGHQSF